MERAKYRNSANQYAFFNGLFMLLVLVNGALYFQGIYDDHLLEFALTILLIGTTYAFIRKSFINPLKKLKAVVGAPSDTGMDEVALVIERYKSLENNIHAATELIRKIEKGELDEAHEITADDALGTSLMSMRDHLKKISAEEKERSWASEGLAKFSDLFRTNDADLNTLCLNVLSHLVKYIHANQGALFVIRESDDSEEYLEMAACYAYNKKKYLNKKIVKGEGLAGQAWIEQDTLFLTDVPQNYLEITSGLGNANPKCILIVPLKVNDEIYGVMELASFSIIPEYQVKFIEKLAESLASTISMVKVNERTRSLLEESQQLTEQMRAQEEEMRQNMEELSATQEELQRKEVELDRKLREALAEIEQGRINQQMNEIALQIEHTIDSCKRDLKFLSNVPPVQGLVRAIANNNFDSQSNSHYDDWIERMDTIFRNFLINKELFQSITFTNEHGKCIFDLSYNGKKLVKVVNGELQVAKQDSFSNTAKLRQAEVHVGQMKSLQDRTMIMEFGIPVFNEKQVFSGAILVNLFAKSIIEGVKSKEAGEHKYSLLSSEGMCIYGNNTKMESTDLKKVVVINQKQQLSLTIMHQ